MRKVSGSLRQEMAQGISTKYAGIKMYGTKRTLQGQNRKEEASS